MSARTSPRGSHNLRGGAFPRRLQGVRPREWQGARGRIVNVCSFLGFTATRCIKLPAKQCRLDRPVDSLCQESRGRGITVHRGGTLFRRHD